MSGDDRCGRMLVKQAASPFEGRSRGRAEEAVGADLAESSRKDVLEEAGDELLGGERVVPPATRMVVPIAKGDDPIFEALDAAIGYGDPVDVAAEILEDRVSAAGVEGVVEQYVLRSVEDV